MLFWMLILVSVLMLVRRFFAGGSTLVNRQTIRYLFLQRLASAVPGMQLVEQHEDELVVRINDALCTIHLDQLFLRCLEMPADTLLIIHEAVAALLDATQQAEGIPADWEQQVVPLLLRADATIPADLLTTPVLEQLVLGYALATGQTFRWLTQPEVDAAYIDHAHLHAMAMRNLERSCNRLSIDAPGTRPDGSEQLLRFITGDGLDAARVLLPSFYQRFSPRFQDNNLLVTIPARDELAMVSQQDQTLVSMLTWRGAQEYAHRAYPLTGDLLLVTEHGLHSWPPSGVTTA